MYNYVLNKFVSYVSVLDRIVLYLYLCRYYIVCIMLSNNFYLTVIKSEKNATEFLNKRSLFDTTEKTFPCLKCSPEMVNDADKTM